MISAKTFFLRSGLSKTASMTRSAPAASSGFCGRGDPGEDLVGLLLGRLPARDGLVEDLLRVVLALLGVGQGDVLEDDLDARHRARVRDARAHHPGAEHDDLARRVLLVAVGPRAALVDRLQVEEERVDHVRRDLPDDEVGEVARLDLRGVVDVDLRALDRRAHDVVRRGHRGVLELLAQVGREGRQVLRELRHRRRAAGDLVALDVPGLDGLGVGLDPLLGLADQLLGRCRRPRRRASPRAPRAGCAAGPGAGPAGGRRRCRAGAPCGPRRRRRAAGRA